MAQPTEYLLRDEAEQLLAELGVKDPRFMRVTDSYAETLASSQSRTRAYERARDLLVAGMASERQVAS